MKGIFEKLKILQELIYFLWKQKLWWLIPLIIIFLIVGIMVVAVGSSPLAPFIYPLF